MTSDAMGERICSNGSDDVYVSLESTGVADKRPRDDLSSTAQKVRSSAQSLLFMATSTSSDSHSSFIMKQKNTSTTYNILTPKH